MTNDIFGNGDHAGGDFELVPEGKHTGIIRYVVDCGHQHDSYQGVASIKHLIFVGWELDCLTKEGDRHWKGQFYTATDFINSKTGEADWFLGGTSNFNKLLRGWTGQDQDTVKWRSFLGNLVNKQVPCTMVIELSEDKKTPGKFYSNIDAVKPYKAVKGAPEPKRVGEVVTWMFGQDGLDDLPGNIRKKILASIEMVEGSYKVPPKDPSKKPMPESDNGIDADLGF